MARTAASCKLQKANNHQLAAERRLSEHDYNKDRPNGSKTHGRPLGFHSPSLPYVSPIV